MINAIILGTTGMIGEGVLHKSLEHPDVESVLVINRKPCGVEHEKLKEIIHKDFFDLSPIRNQLDGYNACFFCLGVSSVGMKEDAYRKLTYDLTLNFAKTVLELNNSMTFTYVSGAGTDSSEQGRSMWARVKGKTENDLMKMPFQDAYVFRPGFIQPMKGIKSSTKLYDTIYRVIAPLYPLLKHLPSVVTSSVQLGRAMISVVHSGNPKKILESRDINQIKVRFH